MPAPYQLKLSIERMQNILKRLWEQKRSQQMLDVQKQKNNFNDKMMRLSQTPRPSFYKTFLGKQTDLYFQLRPSPKMSRAKQNDKKHHVLKKALKAKSKQKPNSDTFLQRTYLHLMSFFASKDAQLRKKLTQERLGKKYANEEKIAENERINRIEF